MKTTSPIIIGIDLGSTIVDRNTNPRYPFPDAIRVIKRVVDELCGPKQTFIVSKVNAEQKIWAKQWLFRNRFYNHTGIPMKNIRFCAERSDKAPICKELGITHFIDDRPEVLFYMKDIVQNRILFQGVKCEVEKYSSTIGSIVRVANWQQVEKILFG